MNNLEYNLIYPELIEVPYSFSGGPAEQPARIISVVTNFRIKSKLPQRTQRYTEVFAV